MFASCLSLYGLKQAPKLWHEKFNKVIPDNGFQASEFDKCLYTKVAGEKVVVICLYVDLLIIGSDLQIVTSTRFLSAQFSIEDLGDSDKILIIKILHSEDGISMCQSLY